jgi:hypothetical protein
MGALIGVLDMAREEHPGSDTLALAEETATELAQRLKLLRAAWDARRMIWISAGSRNSPRACHRAAGSGSI